MIFEKKTLNGFKKNVNGSVRKISKSNLEGNLTFHPSIVERGTLHIFLKVIFQYQNGESIINLKSYHYLYLINHKCNSFSLVFVFMFVRFMSALYISICICISNGQVLLRSVQSDIFQSSVKVKTKTQIQCPPNIFSFSSSSIGRNKIFDSSQYSRLVWPKSNLRKLPSNISPVADRWPDFTKKIESGNSTIILDDTMI